MSCLRQGAGTVGCLTVFWETVGPPPCAGRLGQDAPWPVAVLLAVLARDKSFSGWIVDHSPKSLSTQGAVHRLGDGFTNPQGDSMQMTMEQWPGGRWFRDRGNGVGHLWGHVQAIKAPVLLELSGPMFMSYPAVNHIEVKLEQRPGGTHLDLRHRAMGFLDPAHKQGVSKGWKHLLEGIAQDCSARVVGQRS